MRVADGLAAVEIVHLLYAVCLDAQVMRVAGALPARRGPLAAAHVGLRVPGQLDFSRRISPRKMWP